MELGDKLTLAGIAWQVRPFSAAEHQEYALLAEAAGLDQLAATAQAAMATGGGSTREKLLTGEIARLQARLDSFLEEGAPRDTLSPEEHLEAYGIAAKIDDLTEKRDSVRRERDAVALIAREHHLQALEGVVIEFMHRVLAAAFKDTPALPEFTLAASDDDITAMQDAVILGKLPTGLSASTRQQNAIYTRLLGIVESDSGSASKSSHSRLVEPLKPGVKRRSPKPS